LVWGWIGGDLKVAQQWFEGGSAMVRCGSVVVQGWLGGGSIVHDGPVMVWGWVSCGLRWLGGDPGLA
jgi:hypothetical protein